MRTVYLLAALLISCAAPDPAKPGSELDMLLPPDAREVNRSLVGEWKQISFVVERNFPEFAFTEQGLSRWVRAGWAQCRSKADEWSTYVDEARGTPQRIHQKTVHMARGNELVLLGGMYFSASPGATAAGSRVPDTTTQRGLIIWSTGSPDEIRKLLAPFDAHCP